MWNLLWRNLLHRKVLSSLTIISVALTVALIVFLILVKSGIEAGAEKGYGPFELVVGADGSETQLVLNSFYHVGAPTGNIPYAVFDKLKQHKETDAAFALTTGDNYNGYPIVGIEPKYFPVRYGDRGLAEGRLYTRTGEVVLGSHVARTLGVHVGDRFKGGHGLVEHHESHADEHEGEHEGEAEADEHQNFVYTVVGILPALGGADDRAVFTTLDYAWAVHHNEKAEHREVTAVLVKPKSIGGTQALKLEFDKLDNVQAVYTSKVVADVVNVVDQGTELISIITLLCIVLAVLSIALSLVAAVSERQKDVGLLRLIGKPARFIWFALIGEGLLLTSLGLALGLILGHAGSYAGSTAMFEFSGIHVNAFDFSGNELLLIVGTLLLGLLASLGPAYRVYRVDPLQLFRS